MAAPKPPLILAASEHETGPFPVQLETLPLATSNKTFSRANVFGLFLTISFCLLVQPYGSLLFPRPRHTVCRVVFFFWRLNPLACLLDSALLLIAFTDGIYFAVSRPLSGPGQGKSVWEHIRLTATATRLLRLRCREVPDHWRALDSSEARPNMDIEPGVSNPQLRIEVGRVHFGNAELVVNLVSTIGAVIVVIRLASVGIPLPIRLSAIFMVTNWTLVQSVCSIRNQNDPNPADMKHILRRTMDLERKINHTRTWAALTLLLLPFCGYLTYSALFQTRHLPLHIEMFSVGLCMGSYDLLLLAYFIDIVPGRLQKIEASKCVTPTRKFSIVDMSLYVGWIICGCFVFFLGGFISASKKPEMPASMYLSPGLTIVISGMVYFPDIASMRGGEKGSEWVRGISLTYNVGTAAFFFAGAMILYDEKTTYKPDWLEWFGRLQR